jgi:hypothetical protein
VVKGVLIVVIAFVLLPGSVYMLLAANFGALKGYFIAAVAFFGMMAFLSAVWAFGLPETPYNLGPKGTDPSYTELRSGSRLDAKYGVQSFTGQAGGGWVDEPGQSAQGSAKLSKQDETLKGELDATRQAIVQDLITQTNKTITDSSKELDVTNLDVKVYYSHQAGTTVAAVVVSPKAPPKGSGLQKPSFAPKTFFAFRSAGAPLLPSYIFLVASVALFALHVLGLAWVERRRPLGGALTPTRAETRAARV